MRLAQRENFQRLLTPRHIAFIGGRDAAIAIREARRRGFAGQMWAVNPKRDRLEGVPCVPTIADLPEAPDAAYLAIAAGAVTEALAQLSAMGAGGVVCFSAGFKETGDAAAEQALIEAAGDLALVGPNCYGLINYVGNSALWSFEHGGWSPGYGAAIVTQSGMFSSDITMSQRSLPMAYMVSAGNQAVLGLEDYLDAFATDPAVRAIGLHIEGLQDVARFERAALRALERGLPVVALKSGRSRIGAALTISHTGSLSGANELYEALFDRCGVISVTNPSQFLETLKLLCVTGAPRGARVAGFTCSGGGATMLADHAEKIGLSFPAIEGADRAGLKALLPEIATVSNPLDYTTPIWGQPEHTYPVFSRTLEAVAPDFTVLVQDYPAAGLDDSKVYYLNDAEAFARAATERQVPAAILATIPENMDPDTRRMLIEQGVAPMQGIHETLNAIRDAACWNAARARILTSPPAPLIPPHAPAALTGQTEDVGKDWLRRAGVPVPEGRVVPAREVGSAAGEIGFPVALKMMSRRLAHKTEAGAVALNIRDQAGLKAAIVQMNDAVAAYDAEAISDCFLVETMSPPPLAELILTLRRDAQFGHALVLGSGGVLVELLGDAVTLLLPCSDADVRRALEGLRSAALLRGYRGRPAADLARIARDIHALTQAYLADCAEIAEIEINPLFIFQDRIAAVDVLLHREARC
ncbi:acetate--CoA ligase family protein [Ruegeria sediminis]|uniref:Acetate--CoA ligase family protein n=1 Tax=Ruegeria sediminis TaxID=2583820 RepID=A0ABY2X2X6_9RHOB|nr:acetate--CoA ligase family protein [Ruegeria sediminis]TMV09061.1 acetate--CoA ligase family protein [Ruegeria sediminis]